MKKIHYAVLYTSFLLFANALSANETKFAKLNNQKFGDMKKMTIANNTTSAPKTIFFDTGGKELTLNDFKGRLTLVNFWATWCAPCRIEMPSLDRLEDILGDEKFQVIAIAVEKTDISKIANFYQEEGIKNLKIFHDKSTKSGLYAKATGLPFTLLIDSEGKEVGRKDGPWEWDSKEVLEIINKLKVIN